MRRIQPIIVRRGSSCAATLEGSEGQTLVEYALIFTFVVVISVVGISLLDGNVSSMFSSVVASFS